MIIDTSYPSLFKEGDFHIATPESIKAIIEVKTNIQNQDLSLIIKPMNESAEFIEKGQSKPERLFNGIFSFEGYKRRRNEDVNRYKERISQAIDQKIINGFSDIEILNSSVNFCCLNEDLFLRREPSQSQTLISNQFLSVYNLEGLAFSWFINNLLLYIRKYYRFPQFNVYFPEDKQRKKLYEIPLRE
ncbi:MAG: hypothetical protein ACFE95_03880 [Candidatus Hodarchaeota archaeon]